MYLTCACSALHRLATEQPDGPAAVALLREVETALVSVTADSMEGAAVAPTLLKVPRLCQRS